MPNMSYCRFHNTSMDVEDCFSALRGEYDNYLISKEEIAKANRMLKSMLNFLTDNDLIDTSEENYLGFNQDNFNDMIQNLSE